MLIVVTRTSRLCHSAQKAWIISVLWDKWIGILHHFVDEHEWVLEEGINQGKCGHETLSTNENRQPWVKKESAGHKALTETVLDVCFLNILPYHINFN